MSKTRFPNAAEIRVDGIHYRYAPAEGRIKVHRSNGKRGTSGMPTAGWSTHLKSESIAVLDDAWAALLQDADPAPQPAAAAPEKAELLPPDPKRPVGRPVNASTEIAECLAEDGANVSHWETFESLPEIEAVLDAELKDWRALEQQAAFKGLRIGILVMKARSELKHGQFIPWCAAHLPFTRVTVWRFTRAAEQFLDEKRVSLQTAYTEIAPKMLPGKGPAHMVPVDPSAKAVQLAFAFVGDRTWNELCDHLGMPKRTKVKALPAHEPQIARTPQEKAALLRKTALADWDALDLALNTFVNDKLFAYLEDGEIRQVRRTLQAALSLIHEPGK